MQNVVIVDYGLGNSGSIKNMLKKVGVYSEISNDLFKIERADKLILPGVGAFDDGMSSLQNLQLVPILNKKALVDKVPILGICLGMQLMTKASEEGAMTGLGWLDGETKRFSQSLSVEKLRIPHMGWNVVTPTNESTNDIFKNIFDELRFYFVHSYYVELADENHVAAHTHYGQRFVSAFRKDNIIGMQFHPEKSHKFGMEIFKNFIQL